MPQLLLKQAILIRWCCSTHGWFETGVIVFQHSVNCPECGFPAQYVEHCDWRTTRNLPYGPTRPRLTTEVEAGWQVTDSAGITTRPKSDRPSRLRGGRKSTGRPKRNRATEPTYKPLTYEPEEEV